MSLRITDGIRYQTMLANMKTAQKGTGDLVEQLGTGKRINHPSDDPAGAQSLIEWSSARSEIAQYQDQISSTDLWLQTTDLALGRVEALVEQVADLAAGNVSSGTGERQAAIDTIEAVRTELLSLANETCGDRYLFAGTNADEAAFSIATDAFGNRTYTYEGSGDGLTVAVGRQATLEYSTTGDDVFYENGTSVFRILEDLSTALASGDSAAIGQAADDLETLSTRVLEAQSINGIRQDRLESARAYLTNLDAKLADLVDKTETADTAALAVQFSQQELALEASYKLASRVGNLSILDFMK
ncbi:MAG TPA: flagellar hook-associated protein FlgL [Syntrophales bacterium]|nr:flagellar hook-associated protein FlgL [Syntrophales bacterium]